MLLNGNRTWWERLAKLTIDPKQVMICHPPLGRH